MLLPNRLTLMQRLQDAARHDYTHYTLGQIDLEKWPKFAAKFAGAYDTDLPKSTRSKRRKSGEAVALLYGCEPPPYTNDRRVFWVLVVSGGKGRVHGREQLRELRQHRIELDGYELVHDGVTWTWQMTQKRVNYWRERIHACAARRPETRTTGEDEAGRLDPEIERIMDALYNAPGFRLVRRQVGKLVAYAKAEWKRLRPAGEAQIRNRTYLPIVTRLPNRRPEKRPEAAVSASIAAASAPPPKPSN